jgi:predicted nucleotidyltransferase
MSAPLRRDEIIARIRKHAEAIRAEGATAVHLFGSVARDEARADSDVDVFVDCDPDSDFSLLDMIGIKHLIEDDIGRPVHITTRDSLHPMLRDRILNESIRVL